MKSLLETLVSNDNKSLLESLLKFPIKKSEKFDFLHSEMRESLHNYKLNFKGSVKFAESISIKLVFDTKTSLNDNFLILSTDKLQKNIIVKITKKNYNPIYIIPGDTVYYEYKGSSSSSWGFRFFVEPTDENISTNEEIIDKNHSYEYMEWLLDIIIKASIELDYKCGDEVKQEIIIIIDT